MSSLPGQVICQVQGTAIAPLTLDYPIDNLFSPVCVQPQP